MYIYIYIYIYIYGNMDTHTPHQAGSKEAQECLCAPGFFSETGGIECQPCPLNQYMPYSGAARCESCPAFSRTVSACLPLASGPMLVHL